MGCGSGTVPPSESGEIVAAEPLPADASRQLGTEEQFKALYAQWQQQEASINYSSRTPDYLQLPAFRSIVALGPPAVPLLREVLQADEEAFFLAFAVAEICAWPLDSLYRGPGDQSVRVGVLEQLESETPCGSK